MKSRSAKTATTGSNAAAWLCVMAGIAFTASAMAQESAANTVTLTEPPAARVRADVAEHGITPPTPEGIKNFLKDQGAWYTPFSRPGMTGPYDIRGWHSQPPKTKPNSQVEASQR